MLGWRVIPSADAKHRSSPATLSTTLQAGTPSGQRRDTADSSNAVRQAGEEFADLIFFEMGQPE